MSEREKTLKELLDLLNGKALSNSARLGIMIVLYYEKKMSFSELLSFSGLPKSSLSFHLQILEEEGLIQVVKVPTLAGPRTEIRITDKGREVMKTYFDVVRKLEG